ncbi:iron complex transport system substrate-binding protein [Rhodococcus sp. OK519]|uniref:ABC transporter substrate-binding protein n=1 Tax=Rhodococcus sp. OK519 TaxID=2135729 RepID=UPI000D3C4FFD|nr:iron complex transport system substrate-binding protein [Rhodococcus sp. OK519]
MSSSQLASPFRRIAVAALATVTLAGLVGCGTSTNDDESTIVRTTTKIAGAGVVSVERDTGAACAEPTPADPGAPDPQRIVVLDSATLDAVCALGLWGRVVGATTPEGTDRQPSYLGPAVAGLPAIGSEGTPDIDTVVRSAPDLILGGAPADPALADRLRAVAPTEFVGDDPVFWKARFLATGTALGRTGAARQALDSYTADASRVGAELDARQTQASVVRFRSDSLAVEGPGSFSGQVLADAGVQRPPYQRLEVASKDIEDLGAAEGDVIYVSFDGPAGLEHGTSVMDTDDWYALGAVPDKRVFAVDDEIWNGGNGIVAARAILTDLQPSLNGYA